MQADSPAASKPIILYGSPHSLYAGRARSYLIKTGLRYEEQLMAQRHYEEEVLPKAGGRRSMPTIELPGGAVIRDGVAIVDHFEAERGHSASPTTPRQRIVSRLFDVIGAEGLLRPAMHYRWNFDETQGEFLRFHFLNILPGNDGQDADNQMNNIRTNVNPQWGLTPETVELTETLYLGFLDKFDALLEAQPYLLGGKPCVGDFGLIAPMYGHLGRDPVPLTLMQTHAVRVFRWVERMNNREPDTGEYRDCEHNFLAHDEIPDALIELLQHIAIDFVPETVAACHTINRWLDEHDIAVGSTCKRYAGRATFDVAGTTVSAMAQPFRFYLLRRVQDEFEALEAEDQAAVRDLLDACDMAPVLDQKLSRQIGRHDNLEVWGD